MNASLFIKYINKLNDIHDFAENIAIFPFHNSAELNIKSLTTEINDIIFQLITEVKKKIEEPSFNYKKDPQIIMQFLRCKEEFRQIMKMIDIKNNNLLIQDLEEIENFLKNYQINKDSTNINSTDLTDLKEMILLIMAKRFG